MSAPASSALEQTTMRAMAYGRQQVIELQREVPRSIQRNQVLVQVMCAGLNPVDAKDVLGDKLPHKWRRTRDFVKRHFVEQKTIGFDWSGVVVQCPSNLYKPGDRVFGTMPPLQGSLSEFVAAPLDQVALKPSALTFAQAAALPLVGLTALQSLSPHIKQGGSLLVLGGSGGTGHVALSVAKALGATNICTVCSRRNHSFCLQQGATHTIDYQNGDVLAQLEQYCQNELGGPFDVIMDCVTSADPRDSNFAYPKLLQDAGLVSKKYIRLGGETMDWFRAGCERVLPMSCFGKEKLFWIRFPKSSDELRQLKEWADEGKLMPHVSKVVDFTPEAVQEAFDLILQRRVQGKIVVQVKKESS